MLAAENRSGASCASRRGATTLTRNMRSTSAGVSSSAQGLASRSATARETVSTPRGDDHAGSGTVMHLGRAGTDAGRGAGYQRHCPWRRKQSSGSSTTHFPRHPASFALTWSKTRSMSSAGLNSTNFTGSSVQAVCGAGQ
jgi:hypothetical protein